MADEEEIGETEEGEKKAGGGKGKLLIFIVIGLLLVAISVGGTLFFLGVFDSDEVAEEGADLAEPVAEATKPAMYFPIKPAFVVNFQSRGRTRYLQADVTVMTRNPAVFDAIQMHLPLIKNKLVMLFSGAVYEELQTDEGKELLRQQALVALQEIMQQEIGEAGVEQVLFTNFVMQ